jgi:hypothetical protein
MHAVNIYFFTSTLVMGDDNYIFGLMEANTTVTSAEKALYQTLVPSLIDRIVVLVVGMLWCTVLSVMAPKEANAAPSSSKGSHDSDVKKGRAPNVLCVLEQHTGTDVCSRRLAFHNFPRLLCTHGTRHTCNRIKLQ